MKIFESTTKNVSLYFSTADITKLLLEEIKKKSPEIADAVKPADISWTTSGLTFNGAKAVVTIHSDKTEKEA